MDIQRGLPCLLHGRHFTHDSQVIDVVFVASLAYNELCMSEPDHRDDSAAEEQHEDRSDNEVTHASNEWLSKAGSKISRWLGHGVRLLPAELAINWGTGFATFGVLGTILTGNPTPLLLTAGGTGLAAAGVELEWKGGMKHAKSKAEKSVFWLSKIAQTVGAGAISGLAVLGAPTYLPVATGMYLAGIAMGARAMAHRKDGSHHGGGHGGH
ncbi:MAG: hypothetical protein UZ22_OP11002000909 [Microgenomates bacterium OLB23]|nr:MAG: hypothetical protein UZ22_OP11002000909 [Microgenomates bacterium OLB23]